jgi:hypothetical protein
MQADIFQIYYKPSQRPYLDLAFTPLDNSFNPESHMHEWPVLENALNIADAHGLDALGFVSWQWNAKTHLTGKTFVDFIKNNPDSNIWVAKPYTPANYPFVNPFVHGEHFHPGMMAAAKDLITAAGYTTDLETDAMPMVFFDFFAMTRAEWQEFLLELARVKTIALETPHIRHVMFETDAHYEPNPNVKFWIFFAERFINLYLQERRKKFAALEYKHQWFSFWNWQDNG